MTTPEKRKRAPRNRTLVCSGEEKERLSEHLVHLDQSAGVDAIIDRILHQDFFDCVQYLPEGFVDLLVVDPPYNLTKNFDGRLFRSRKAEDYSAWFETTVQAFLPLLAPTATVYVCSDWRTSNVIFPVLDRHLVVRNRITWEREKGRGAKVNWKNNTEDIWFCTAGDEFHFDVDAVKLKRKVLAPYRRRNGEPKDWQESGNGNFRLTHPSNLWSDITVPFWSMPENTDHPTQKPEKLLAKLVLASSAPGDLVFDPFVGSGTAAVVAKKLDRRFVGVEISHEYCCWAQKRLARADADRTIQGYSDGVFWERNSLPSQLKQTDTRSPGRRTSVARQKALFS